MKKFFSILIVGLMVLPMVAKAKSITYDFEQKEVGECVTVGDGTCTKTYEVTLKLSEEVEFTSIPIEVTYTPHSGKQNGVTKIDFKEPAEGWSVFPNQTENGYTAIYYPAGGSITAKEIKLGTFIVTTKEGEEYDCSLGLRVGKTNVDLEIVTETTPNTGASLPLIIIGAGAVIAGAIYVTSKKNTKLYKI